jgi:hypothetical protein
MVSAFVTGGSKYSWTVEIVSRLLPWKKGAFLNSTLTYTDIKFLLLHETKSEDAIRQFFTDVYDLYVKTALSPFYFVNDPITNPQFDLKVKAVAKKYL